MKKIYVSLLLLFCLDVRADVVLISLQDGSEAELGKFPVSRDVYSKAINALYESQAQAVIFKFFIDQSKNTAEEKELELALRSIPVVMQAEFTNGGIINSPDKLSRRIYTDLNTSGLPNYKGGYFPLEVLSPAVKSIGYANARGLMDFQTIDLLSRFEGSIVPSMILLTVEEIVGKPAIYEQGYLTFNGREIAVSNQGFAQCDYMKSISPLTFSFQDLLNKTIDPKELKGKVVILGYDRSDSPKIKVNTSDSKEYGIHKIFALQVQCLLTKLLKR